MPRLRPKHLSTKLISFFVAVAMVPIAVTGYISFSTARESLQEAQLSALAEARDLRKQELRKYFAATFDLLTFLSTYDRAFMACDWLEPAGNEEKDPARPAFWKVSSSAPPGLSVSDMLSELRALYTTFLVYNGRQVGYHDLLVVASDDGIVRFTARKLSDFGADVKEGALKSSGLGAVWKKVVETGKPVLVDMSTYEPAGEPAMFAGVPLMGPDGMVRGVVAARIGCERISSIVAATGNMGGTGMCYLVGPDRLLRTDLASVDGFAALKKRVDSEAIREALSEKTGIRDTEDFDGVAVLSSYTPVGLNRDEAYAADFDWALIAEKSRAEVSLPVWHLAQQVGLIALFVAVVVGLVAVPLAGSIAGPIAGLTDWAKAVSSGDLSLEVDQLKRDDEVGVLNDAFRSMVENLREQARQLLAGVTVLRSAGTEISSTVSQVVAGASKTSFVVTDTVSTVEQLKQAARVADERAQDVERSAEEAVKVSAEGKKATDDTVVEMNFVKEQMESAGRTVMRLSEQSLAIEQIISTVQDLADQSNLLAVNASIEAARAGDQGKGFAVVAHEIKSLADQSKEATDRVRKILEEIRKWVGAAVMATEQGGKAVESGLSQAMTAGESIEILTSRVVESSRAANVIVESIRQQFAGIDQVAGTMAHIDKRVRENLSGMSQLESSAKSLDELGEALKHLAERYKI